MRDVKDTQVLQALKVTDITKLGEDEAKKAIDTLNKWITQAKESESNDVQTSSETETQTKKAD